MISLNNNKAFLIIYDTSTKPSNTVGVDCTLNLMFEVHFDFNTMLQKQHLRTDSDTQR